MLSQDIKYIAINLFKEPVQRSIRLSNIRININNENNL